jgi:hypothetical protein
MVATSPLAALVLVAEHINLVLGDFTVEGFKKAVDLGHECPLILGVNLRIVGHGVSPHPPVGAVYPRAATGRELDVPEYVFPEDAGGDTTRNPHRPVPTLVHCLLTEEDNNPGLLREHAPNGVATQSSAEAEFIGCETSGFFCSVGHAS